MAVHITEQVFGAFGNKTVNKYTIRQQGGIQVSVINYGASLTGIIVPDKTGVPGNIVLGFENLEGYINADSYYMGSICGRFANRISNAVFELNGVQYQLSMNDDNSCLHGGLHGFDKAYWNAAILEDEGVQFTYTSKDGEEGFPGNLDISVTYKIKNNSLTVNYEAVTDKATPVNLTNHAYFNLSSGKDADISNHQLEINASHFLEVNNDLIPTGQLLEVKNTPMDFTSLKEAINGNANGYDHCWVLNKQNGELVHAATLTHQATGRVMEVLTTQPGLHFYSGHSLNGHFGKSAGLCLETQHFPDSPNQPSFPGTILNPGEVYRQTTIFQFSNLLNKKYSLPKQTAV